MNSKTITLLTPFEAPANWFADDDLYACFRTLYRRLLQQSPSQRLVRVVGITSCSRGAGVSTIAGGLAAAATKDCEGRVLLVDAGASYVLTDKNAVEEWAPGFLDVLFGSCSIDRVLHPSSMENLWMLPAGSMPPHPASRNVSPLAVELFGSLLLEFSFIVVDMAPVDELNHAPDVMAAVDGVVLVVEAGSTRRSHALAASDRLSGTRLLGSVLNKCQGHRLNKLLPSQSSHLDF